MDDMDILEHYGMPRRSGRYPWGSGDNPYQRTGDFISRVNKMKADGMSEGEIARELEIVNYRGEPSPSRLRTQLSVAKNYRRSLLVEQAKDMKAKGLGATEIGEKMGLNESTVRSLLNTKAEARMLAASNTAKYLKEEIDKNGMIDVGSSVERKLGVTRTTLDNALMILEMEGYPTYGGRVPQVTNKGQMTTLKVVCPPGAEKKDIYDYAKIHQLGDRISSDGGETFDPVWVYPKSLDSKRVQIRYAEEGGKDKDGVVEIRPGVEDVSLGGSSYAQVRVLVDGTHYIKGMAVYGDPADFPEGVDMIFNTNKHVGTPMLSDDPNAKCVLKPIDKANPTNPFGSLIKDGIVDPDDPSKKEGGQRYYYDENGEKQLSVINKRADAGDWNEWSHDLPSQFLSKQNNKLVKQQLDLAKIDKQSEYEEICALTNPTVKKHLLLNFANDCDSAAVHLKAAALPRQRYQVILPLTTLGDDEVYAPNYKPGEKVALIRYPHGGTFEIPILKVNNKNAEGRRVIGPNPPDAVGINAKVAERLSGADFDGDTVMVIPLSGKANITSTPTLPGLEGFDPKEQYGGKPAGTFKQMTKPGTQMEMGKVSNLITDMTIGGAGPEELAKAVRHSMVVIDAYKHKLDYKQSEIDNDIPALKRRWQGHTTEDGRYSTGAATIISQAKGQASVPKYRGVQKIDPETGKLYWDSRKTPETYVDKNGKTQTRMVRTTKMAATDDAMKLVSEGRTQVELLYADYANTMKSLANDARKEYVSAGRIERSSEAAQKYAAEVANLEAQLNVAKLNEPRERQAQLNANANIKLWLEKNPDATNAEIKKQSQRELSNERAKLGAKRSPVKISPEQWEAIQAGAVSENVLTNILKYTDIDVVRGYATPRASKELSAVKQARIHALQNSGYTNQDIADALGVSVSTVLNYLD
ncbi:MAG: helix-turn-helix domain-containing protein [Ruminococcaceae bacterium]|nr:helix-turn-helix domain-containing protein [Oscillospiraceae bacterium]